MHIVIMENEENIVKLSKNSSDVDWIRLEKWRIGRANYP